MPPKKKPKAKMETELMRLERVRLKKCVGTKVKPSAKAYKRRAPKLPEE